MVPQLLQLAYLVFHLVLSSGDPEELRLLPLLLLPNVGIVLAAVLVAGLCRQSPAAKPFGNAVLASTLVGAAVFTLVCCAGPQVVA